MVRMDWVATSAGNEQLPHNMQGLGCTSPETEQESADALRCNDRMERDSKNYALPSPSQKLANKSAKNCGHGDKRGKNLATTVY